jgi:phage gp16-like protein
MSYSSRFHPGNGNRLIGNSEKAAVHIAKAQLGQTEKEYRAALAKVGVTTSKDLTFRKFHELMDNFKADGFRPYAKRAFVRAPEAGFDKAPMLKKIAAILGDLGLQWRYADGVSRQMFSVDSCSWCTPEQLHKVIAVLEYHRKKAGLKGDLKAV